MTLPNRPRGETSRWNIPAAIGLLIWAGLALTGCGGGGSSSPPPPQQNPVPVLNSISPTTTGTGGAAFTLTVNGSSFISSSVVRWNGSDRPTTFVGVTRLTAAVSASDIATDGAAQVTVFNPAPGGGTSAAATFTITPVSPLVIGTTQLPATGGGKVYDFTLAAEGGVPPLQWSISSGILPSGLSIDAAAGRIAGTTDPVGADTDFPFIVQATDSSATPLVGVRALSITVVAGNLGSNNACSPGTTTGTTRISNGRIRASISPYGDIDVYSFNGTMGNQVTIEVFAQRLDLDGSAFTRDSQMDSMLELLDSSCPDPQLGGGPPILAFNDDIVTGDQQDSRILNYTLQNTDIYFIRVRDFRGDGRPDLIYELSLSGAD